MMMPSMKEKSRTSKDMGKVKTFVQMVVYMRAILNDLANGRGRIIYADGDIYAGDWVNGKAEG